MSSVSSRLHGIFTKTRKATHNIPTITATATAAAASEVASAASDVASAAASPATEKTPKTLKQSDPSRVQDIVKKFKRSSRSTRFRANQDNYEATVRRLAAGGHYSAIESIIEHQKKYTDSMANEGFAVRLIGLYGRAKMFDNAYKLFDELPSLNVTRTVFSFNALLSAGVNSKKFDKIIELLREMPQKLSIEPDIVSYNTLVKALCEMGSLDSAITTIDEMEKNGISPNIVTYNTVIEAYYKDNRVSEAEELLGQMQEKGIIANARSYNPKLRFLIRDNRVVEAVALVEEMEKGEVKPDRFSYNAVIKGCVDDGNLEEAKRLYDKMEESECSPDHTTFGTLIPFVCEKGDIDFALELCKNAIELKQSVYNSLMQRVVDELVAGSRVEEAKELVALVNSSSSLRYTMKVPEL